MCKANLCVHIVFSQDYLNYEYVVTFTINDCNTADTSP